MKYYIVCMYQLILWSGYSLAVWLSQKDHIFYKSLLFLMFVYFALLIGKKYLITWKSAWMTAFISLGCYYSIHEIVKLITKRFFF